ncbi:M64 family metallopeptidase [Dyadobacter sp.]|uniref:M64 family metallopeptidase n=1 Tax=Dyadobacter sp. TaxID=1914288 RepID=UPI003F6F4852
MKRTFTTLVFTLLLSRVFGQTFPVDTLYKSGPVNNRINVVILGDGFTKEQLPKFNEEARKFAEFFLDYAPYNKYRNYFNFFSIPTPSEESGVTNPGTAPDAYPDQPVGQKKTFYGGTFGSSIHRLVTVNYGVAFNVLAANFPAYDLTVMLVNTQFYGGSGGSIAVHTLNESANTIGAHEIGHTFAALNDEYWAGPQYGREAPNMTAVTDRSRVKWKNWLDIPGIGIYKHGEDGPAATWHKPSNATCLMEYLNQQFCVVCREATTETILSLVNPVEQIEPDNASEYLVTAPAKFSLGLLKPAPNSLYVEWDIDGKKVAAGVDEITLAPSDLPATGKLTATVFDSTHLSRSEALAQQRVRKIQWNLKSNSPAILKINASDDSLCVGGFVTLTASGCPGEVSWSTDETASSIRIQPDKTTSIQASCVATDQKASVTITVLPLPVIEVTNKSPYLEGSSIVLNATGASTYTWKGPREFTATGAEITIPVAIKEHSGKYSVTGTDVYGCSASAETELLVERLLSAGNGPEEWVRVSPNPASDFIKVATNMAGKSTLTLLDLSGKIIRTKTFTRETELKLPIQAGVYLYKVTNGEREFSGKLAVQ